MVSFNKACSKLIVVCQTFALYSASFTKSANQAIAATLEDPNTDSSKAKRWDVLNKFETNFNHWYGLPLGIFVHNPNNVRS